MEVSGQGDSRAVDSPFKHGGRGGNKFCTLCSENNAAALCQPCSDGHHKPSFVEIHSDVFIITITSQNIIIMRIEVTMTILNLLLTAV
jgi:hypothetical protein